MANGSQTSFGLYFIAACCFLTTVEGGLIKNAVVRVSSLWLKIRSIIGYLKKYPASELWWMTTEQAPRGEEIHLRGHPTIVRF